MRAPFARLSIALTFLLLSTASARAEAVRETLYFLADDGRGYIGYRTFRSGQSSQSLSFDKGMTREAALADVLYLYPNQFTWEDRDKQFNKLRFGQGSYSVLESGSFGERVRVDASGQYVYENDASPRANGHYGFWNDPSDYAQFTYVWVLPASLEIVSYACNRPGEWVKRHDTLAYFGKDVNDLVFTIRYRPRGSATYDALRSLGDRGIQVAPQADGAKVALDGMVLFASGSDQLSERGKALLGHLVAKLERQEVPAIAVEGHTDDQPITGALAATFRSNWALSSARALAVAHALIQLGFPESKLEVRAYGAQRPRTSNGSEQGRAQNRRIELDIVEQKPRTHAPRVSPHE